MTSLPVSAWKILIMGGPMMLPILLCSIFSMAIIVERWLYLFSSSTNTKQFKENILEQIKADNVREAINLCENSPLPLAQVLKAGILQFGASREEVKAAIEEAALFETPKLEKKLTALLTISHIAPLLGFLGTVIGIANVLFTIESRNNSLVPLTTGDLAGGIWQALVTTIAGLIVAIPTFLFYNFFVSRVNALVLEMERGAAELVNLLTQLSEARISKKGGYRDEV